MNNPAMRMGLPWKCFDALVYSYPNHTFTELITLIRTVHRRVLQTLFTQWLSFQSQHSQYLSSGFWEWKILRLWTQLTNPKNCSLDKMSFKKYRFIECLSINCIFDESESESNSWPSIWRLDFEPLGRVVGVTPRSVEVAFARVVQLVVVVMVVVVVADVEAAQTCFILKL